MDRSCPDCGIPLEAETFERVQLDVCGECAGIWMDRGEIVRIRNLGADEMHRLEDLFKPKGGRITGDSSCPVCRKELEWFQYLNGPVRLLRCPDGCGLWVRDGQIDALAAGTKLNEAAALQMADLDIRTAEQKRKKERMDKLMKALQQPVRSGSGLGW